MSSTAYTEPRQTLLNIQKRFDRELQRYARFLFAFLNKIRRHRASRRIVPGDDCTHDRQLCECFFEIPGTSWPAL